MATVQRKRAVILANVLKNCALRPAKCRGPFSACQIALSGSASISAASATDFYNATSLFSCV
eukprot:11195460-Lingulodinium_polyedra.AAC.1